MRRLVVLTFLTALASVPLAPRVAHADDAAVVEAKARFDEGLALADQGQYEAARVKFQQAYAVFKSATVLFNLARTEQVTGHELEALNHFRLFLRVSGTDSKINDSMRERAKANVTELSRKVSQVDIEAPTDARLTVDGKALEEAPKEPVPVEPGRHTIEATFQGRVKSVSVECGAGNVVKAKIEFESGGPTTEPPGVAPSSGWTPVRIATVSGLGALAVTGIVLGFVFHGSASNKVDQAQTLTMNHGCLDAPASDLTCAKAAQLRSDRDSAVTLSTVSFIGGTVLAAGAVTAALLWPQSSREHAQLVPTIGPGFAGASLGGSF